MAAWGGAAHLPIVAGDDPDPAAAAADAAAALRRAEEEEIWVGGNPNHLHKANTLTPMEEDNFLIEVLRRSERIMKEELVTYRIIPGHLHNHGLAVRTLVFELYTALESSSRARRQLLKLMLDGQDEKPEANVLRAVLKEDEHVLRANPEEIHRRKSNIIVKVQPYILLDPVLLPKAKKVKKGKKSKK